MTLRSVLGRETNLQLLVPLTSALASMILFEVGAGRYALPAASVIELAESVAYPSRAASMARRFVTAACWCRCFR